MNTVSKSALVFAVLCGTLLLEGTASATSRPTVIDGYLDFYQNQGNFCDSSARDCTGSKYTDADFQTETPVRNMRFRVQLSNGQVIGQGTTGSGGFFTARLTNNTSEPYFAGIIFTFEHDDGRFRVVNANGSEHSIVFWVRIVPRAFNFAGRLVVGGPPNPDAFMNVYDGAVMMWENSLSQTNRMNAYFDDLDIRAFDNSACPTSCADGPNNRVVIDSWGSGFMPQRRVMHEMGHIASYRASRDQSFRYGGDYNWPLTGTAQAWNPTTGEWGAAQFEEGVATHLADVGLYFPNAASPASCLSSLDCNPNLENGLGAGCSPNDTRAPLQAMRYFWDNYDSNADYTGETLSQGVWHVVDTIHAFDPGQNDNQKDEPWGGSGLDDRDGRSILDFSQLWAVWGTDSSTQLTNNCGGVGD